MKQNNKEYTIEEHVHRYAVWTVARASKRNFATTGKIQEAIEVSDLRSFMDRLEQSEVTPEQFDDAHQAQARSLIKAFKSLGVKATYGRAAKIIAIYLKTAQVIRFPESNLSRVIHPPIDAILLKRLAKREGLKGKGLRNERWTKWEDARYFELIDMLRAWSDPRPFWMLEAHWDPAGG